MKIKRSNVVLNEKRLQKCIVQVNFQNGLIKISKIGITYFYCIVPSVCFFFSQFALFLNIFAC